MTRVLFYIVEIIENCLVKIETLITILLLQERLNSNGNDYQSFNVLLTSCSDFTTKPVYAYSSQLIVYNASSVDFYPNADYSYAYNNYMRYTQGVEC